MYDKYERHVKPVKCQKWKLNARPDRIKGFKTDSDTILFKK